MLIVLLMLQLISDSPKTRSLIKKASFLRLAKSENSQFTGVNEEFSGKRNEKNGVFLQRLIKEPVCQRQDR